MQCSTASSAPAAHDSPASPKRCTCEDARRWSRDDYDDENWMALALMRAYDRFGAAKYLTQAKALVADIEAAWDTSCCGAHPGGIWWDRPHTQKAMAANAGPRGS